VTGSGRWPLLRDLAGTPLPLREDGSPSQDPADIVDAIDARVPAELASTPGVGQGSAVHAADANGPVHGSPLTVPASAVKPGDYLPPQRCLDPSAWQDCGFPVGARPEDVCRDHPSLPGTSYSLARSAS